jgi:hypothetical protein
VEVKRYSARWSGEVGVRQKGWGGEGSKCWSGLYKATLRCAGGLWVGLQPHRLQQEPSAASGTAVTQHPPAPLM